MVTQSQRPNMAIETEVAYCAYMGCGSIKWPSSVAGVGAGPIPDACVCSIKKEVTSQEVGNEPYRHIIGFQVGQMLLNHDLKKKLTI